MRVVDKSNEKRYSHRCKSCREDRIDGKPCTPSKCLCSCHRKPPIRLAYERDRDTLRAMPGMEGWCPPKSFEEELAEGKFGPVGPRRLK